MAAKLNMVFTVGKGSKTVALADPKPDLTKAQVEAAMQTIVDKKAFFAKAGPVDGIKDAFYKETVTTQLAE